VLVAVGTGVPNVGDGVGVCVASGVAVSVGVCVGRGVRVGGGVPPGGTVIGGSASGSRVARGVGVGNRCLPVSFGNRSHEDSATTRNKANKQPATLTPPLATYCTKEDLLVGIS
jgi:hypothetical protein